MTFLLSCLVRASYNPGGEAAFFAPKFLRRLPAAGILWALSVCLLLLCASARAAPSPDDSVIRQKLVQAILSQGADQLKRLDALADSGAKVVHDVLVAWSHDGVYLYNAPDGSKTPVL